MNKHLFLYVANWKSYLTHAQGCEWLKLHADELQNYQDRLIICPDFTVLAQMATLLPHSMRGAQNCSACLPGAYTGEVTAQSLASCGVGYCIVGHWERVSCFGESPETTGTKSAYLLKNNITPIICVTHEYESKLHTIYDRIKDLSGDLIIAYEPVSAIGTGTTPSYEDIEQTITALRSVCASLNEERCVRVLYGGSVQAHNAQELKKIKGLDGLLIGKTSTDFQELKKIVEC